MNVFNLILKRLMDDIGLTHVERILIVFPENTIHGVGMNAEPMDAPNGVVETEIIEECVYV